jgi:hypothetical protein
MCIFVLYLTNLSTDIDLLIINFEFIVHQHHPPLFHHHRFGTIELRGVFVRLCKTHRYLAFYTDHRRHTNKEEEEGLVVCRTSEGAVRDLGRV